MNFLISIFIFWRFCLFLIAWIGGKILPFTPSFPYSDIYLIPSGLPSWLWSFANFDGVHYLTIAQKGYSAQFTQVFFPLYPLIINIISKIIPFINPVLIGILVSNVFFLLSLFVFWKLLSLDYKKQDIRWIILFLIIFPTSFFFGSIYTESIFLFFVVLSFYAARKKRWWIAGIFGGLAGATRLVGILLLPALLWEWQQEKLKMTRSVILNLFQDPYKMPKLVQHDSKKIFHFPFSTFHFLPLYLVPLGLIAYMVYLQLTFGDWLYFWHVQPVFGAERSGGGLIFLPQVIYRYLKILFTVPWKQYDFWVSVWELGSVVAGFGLLVIGWLKKIRSSYLVFAFLAITMPTLTGTFSSMPRYILVAFPMFIALGLIKNKSFKILLSVVCYLLSGIFIILFTRGYWVS
ncbi:hypothetical protein HZB96_03690 [Candidatus Gottesmanbacteria bacterium]|nr:hypothetical protein [Candidatus Gottesmanbacteria bacterium]